MVDLRGRRVASVFHGPLDAGTHEFQWNSNATSGGVYTVRASGRDGTIASTRVVLQR